MLLYKKGSDSLEEKAIIVNHLVKKYGQFVAVNDLSFSVDKGSLFAFLGVNGAGKSTTIEILCTLLEATSGEIIINGHVLGSVKTNNDIRNSIGIVFQQSILDGQLTVKENIIHRAKLYSLNKKEIEENYRFVKEFLHLSDIEKKLYGNLSGGQKRRVDIARAIIHRPKILFLDEPTTGLDPHTRQFVWKAIARLQEESNMTIFLTTHYMEEAAFADNIVVIKQGKIIAQGTPNQLKETYAKDLLVIAFKEGVHATRLLLEKNYEYTAVGDVFHIKISSTLDAIPIINELKDHFSSFEVIKATMDDVFITMNGGETNE